MKKGISKFTAFCMAAGMTLGGTNIVSYATGTELSLVGVSGAKEPAKTVVTEETASEEVVETSEEDDTEEAEEAAVEEMAQADADAINTRGFAQCEEYVNIRAVADVENGEVLGKLKNNAAVYIEDVTDDGWYKVRSGNVEGYVAAAYIATGDEAEVIAETAGYNVAEVGAEALNVRASASDDSTVVTTVYGSDQIEVIEDCGEWLKVAVGPDCYGYVSVDYVNAETQYGVAESVEEEEARLNAEYEAYLAEQAYEEQYYSEPAYYEESYGYTEPTYYEETYTYTEPAYYEETYTEPTYYEETYTEPSYTESYSYGGDAQAAADAAYQAYLDAQATADAATQQADEQLVYDTAADAQEAYQAYLNAQAAADEQSYQSQSTPTYTEEYTEEVYSDDGYYEEAYTEEEYVEGGYEEYVEPSYSSVGSEIANFGCQFVGNPYVWGGTSLTNGADCSGFTQSVMSHFGIYIPRTAAEQCGSGTPVDLGSIQPGDLLFYNGDGGIGHVSIYIGGGQVVHASNSNTGIIISDYSYRSPCAARRYW